MIVFKEKSFVAPLLAAMGGKAGLAIMGGSTALSMGQAHMQGKAAEEQAEESQRLQRQMNKQLAKIADSGDPAKGQAAAAVLQGQSTFSDLSKDIGDDTSEGLKKAGNAIGGATGTVAGGAAGSVLGGVAGLAGAKMANKFAGTKLGMGKAGAIGAAAGLIGGSILGGQKGSSLFSEKITEADIDRIQNTSRIIKSEGPVTKMELESDLARVTQKTYAVGTELVKAGKGLLKVAGQHKGTIAEGIGSGVLMGATGYAANKAIQSDKEKGTDSALKKIGLGAGAAMLGAMALKKGANYKLLGEGAYRNRKAIGRAAGATMTGVGFGAGIAALPKVMEKSQADQMRSDTGGVGGEKKESGNKTKMLLGAGLTAAALVGGHKLAKAGKLGQPLQRTAQNISGKIEAGKEGVLKKISGNKSEEVLKARKDFKAAKDSASSVKKYENPTFKEKPAETILDKTTAFMGGGTQKTQRLADQLKATDSGILQKTGDFMKKHKKTALLGAAIPGYAATMGAWQAGEDATTKVLKKVDPKAYQEDNDSI